MLNTALGAVIGVLGIAVAADWLSWQKRTIAMLKAHADLAASLPRGEAKGALEEHLENDVASYVGALDRRRRRKGIVFILGMTAAGVLLAAGGVAADLVDGVDNSWPRALTWFGLSIEVIGVVLIKRLDNQLESQDELPEPLPSETLKGAAGHDVSIRRVAVPDKASRDERTDETPLG